MKSVPNENNKVVSLWTIDDGQIWLLVEKF